MLKISKKEETPFDRQKLIHWWDQNKLGSAKIMVVGAGAIGNEVIKNLALMGVGYIFIVDFDIIEKSNLSRTVLFNESHIGKRKAEVAAEKAKELALADNFVVKYFHGDLNFSLGALIYKEFDMVLGCLDNIEARLSVNRNCFAVNTPWIDSGIHELRVRINKFLPENKVCYECNLSEKEIAKSRERYSCFNLKKETFSSGKVPTTQIASSIAAALQVQETLKILFNKPEAKENYLFYDGNSNELDAFTQKENSACLTHKESYKNILELPMSASDTVSDFFLKLEKVLPGKAQLVIKGESWSFIKAFKCSDCGSTVTINKPDYLISVKDISCDTCIYEGKNSEITPDFMYQDEIDAQDMYQDYRLSDLGYPLGAVLTIKHNGQHRLVGLAKDVKMLL